MLLLLLLQLGLLHGHLRMIWRDMTCNPPGKTSCGTSTISKRVLLLLQRLLLLLLCAWLRREP